MCFGDLSFDRPCCPASAAQLCTRDLHQNSSSAQPTQAVHQRQQGMPDVRLAVTTWILVLTLQSGPSLVMLQASSLGIHHGQSRQPGSLQCSVPACFHQSAGLQSGVHGPAPKYCFHAPRLAARAHHSACLPSGRESPGSRDSWLCARWHTCACSPPGAPWHRSQSAPPPGSLAAAHLQAQQAT